MTYRTAAPPYMNSKPLVWGLADEPLVECSYMVPSSIASMLRSGELAAGLVSVAALFSDPNLQIMPGISISCDGPAESVKIFLNRPIDSGLRKVALDFSSMSSILLAKLVLREKYGLEPEFVLMPPVIPEMLAACDAAVTIGDTTMCEAKGRYSEVDLGEEWHTLTGLPFVFAVWAVNPSMASGELVEILRRSKELGLSCLREIAGAESGRLGLSEALCHEYLSDTMDYELTERHLKAVALFRDKAQQYGFDSGIHKIGLYE